MTQDIAYSRPLAARHSITFGLRHKALNPLLEDLADSSDAVYLADPRWPSVVHAARSALDGMRNPPTGATS